MEDIRQLAKELPISRIPARHKTQLLLRLDELYMEGSTFFSKTELRYWCAYDKIKVIPFKIIKYLWLKLLEEIAKDYTGATYKNHIIYITEDKTKTGYMMFDKFSKNEVPKRKTIDAWIDEKTKSNAKSKK